MILAFSLVGIAGSYAVAWFGMRVNTFANSRTAFASLAGYARPVYAVPLKSGMSIGMVLISVELLIMLVILLFVPRNLAGPCFIGFAIGESQIGRASCRERVEISVVAVSLKKQSQAGGARGSFWWGEVACRLGWLGVGGA